jgi:hypothetical protein
LSKTLISMSKWVKINFRWRFSCSIRTLCDPKRTLFCLSQINLSFRHKHLDWRGSQFELNNSPDNFLDVLDSAHNSIFESVHRVILFQISSNLDKMWLTNSETCHLLKFYIYSQETIDNLPPTAMKFCENFLYLFKLFHTLRIISSKSKS